MISFRKMALMLMTVSLVACNTTTTTDEYASKMTIYNDKIVMVDANSFVRLKDEQRAVIEDINYDLSLSLNEVLSANIEVKELVYDMPDITDKRNPNAQFYKNIPNFFMLEPRNYVGRDDWSRESGTERNTSIEYWLMGEALRLSKEDPSLIDWRPDLVGGKQVNGIDPDIFIFNSSRKGMIKMIEFVLEAGFSEAQAESLAAHCYGDTFFFFKYGGTTSKEEIKKIDAMRANMPNVERSGKVKPNLSACDYNKGLLKKAGESIFAGHKRYAPKVIRNKSVKTVYIDNPKFSVQFWQHLMSDSLYRTNSFVQKRGVFTGLVTPESPNLFLGFLSNINGSNATLFNDPYSYAHQQEVSAGHLAYQWLGDEKFVNNFFSQTLSRKWEEMKSISALLGGKVLKGLITCNMDMSKVNVQVNGYYFNRYYDCSMGVDRNVRADAKANFSSFKPYQGTGYYISPLTYTAYIDFTNHVTSDLSANKLNCSDAIYVAGCEANKVKDLSWLVESRMMQTATPNTLFAFTRLNDEGKTEGVVHYFGTQFIFNLEEIRTWYISRSN